MDDVLHILGILLLIGLVMFFFWAIEQWLENADATPPRELTEQEKAENDTLFFIVCWGMVAGFFMFLAGGVVLYMIGGYEMNSPL